MHSVEAMELVSFGFFDLSENPLMYLRIDSISACKEEMKL